MLGLNLARVSQLVVLRLVLERGSLVRVMQGLSLARLLQLVVLGLNLARVSQLVVLRLVLE
jgi:hypothetical protein